MELIQFEIENEINEMYWSHYEDGTVGFVLFPESENDECVPLEQNIGLEEFNKLFFTDFTIEQFIQAVQQLTIEDFTEIVETVIQYSETPHITIIKATRIFQELFGSIIEIDESTINTSKNNMGYIQFMSHGIVVFVINRYGVIIRIAFTDNYLPTFFDTSDIIETDVFNILSKDILLNKLIEHYVIGLPIVREELRNYIRNYTRKKKIETILN